MEISQQWKENREKALNDIYFYVNSFFLLSYKDKKVEEYSKNIITAFCEGLYFLKYEFDTPSDLEGRIENFIKNFCIVDFKELKEWADETNYMGVKFFLEFNKENVISNWNDVENFLRNCFYFCIKQTVLEAIKNSKVFN